MATAATNQTPRYDRLRFVLGQGDKGEGAIVKDALHAQGIHHVADCNGSADRLFNALDAEIVDLVVYDFELLRDRFVSAMQFIRRKSRGRNPFVVIVATVENSDAETVRRLVRAGVDDLIRRPVTGQHLFESVDSLMRKRKPFMVTHDYVGPSRRVHGRSESSGAFAPIEVPNTMRSRAIDNVSEEELERMVDAAVANLRDRQLLACGYQVEVLARQLLEGGKPAAESFGRIEDVHTILKRLEAAADDLRNRCRGTQFERIGDLAKMLLALTQRADRGTTGRANVEVQLIGKLAEAIRRALVTERESVGVMQDIASTIAHYTGDD